ncbi:glyoxal oxidase N-terminus-domain-containing protein [Flagelloscypha sp. PMI_526]|nr:glyoxal oxidase N-terminus-domain-containing protein [Flagelloscypha sp. PMI_526]
MAILAISSLFLWVSTAQAVINGQWSLVQQGTTGVNAQQLAIVTETTAVIFDKVENNPLVINGHKAWGAELDLTTNTVRALYPITNTWCAAGSFLSNGTFTSTGGNPVQDPSSNGLQAIRLYEPCQDQSCQIQEYPRRVRLTSSRWYPSSARLDDGSVMILGGSTVGGYINRPEWNNPTFEFYPAKNIHGQNGLQIHSQFMEDTLNSNHFPIMLGLPDGTIFVAANTKAMILNWKTNTERRLPDIPNGVRITSPFSTPGALLPLSAANSYTPEVLICGGSTVLDTTDPWGAGITSQIPASSQCIRMVLTDAGIAAGWQVEQMPTPRIMGELVHMPDGRLLLVNGAQTGVGGYGNVQQQIGESNADNPCFTPQIYDPAAPAGSRFSAAGIPASSIPRLYHSVATLTPNGSILLAGSNPNTDVQERQYPTEYRIEYYLPAYLSEARPTFSGIPATVNYGAQFKLNVTFPANTTSVSVVLIDLGFATHAVHMDHRMVTLQSSIDELQTQLTVTGPPSAGIYPPGPGFLYVVTNRGVPSVGKKLIIGTGASPPVDQAAIRQYAGEYGQSILRTTVDPVPLQLAKVQISRLHRSQQIVQEKGSRLALPKHSLLLLDIMCSGFLKT